MSNDNQLGVNLSFTKFLFVILPREDEPTRTRLRAAGDAMWRGFFNDYDADGTREPQVLETIQFLVTDQPRGGDDPIHAARYVAQVSAKYRPRVEEAETELRRRLAGRGDVYTINGAKQALRYTSAQMYAFAYKVAVPRASGRVARNAIIIPIKKTAEWWTKDPLDRHAYFYPHQDLVTRTPVKGHARAAEAGITTVFRRLYHNPDGYQREGEFDFVTYFECSDEHLVTFDRICRALRDERQNPEWRYVLEGPEWRGRRVLRW